MKLRPFAPALILLLAMLPVPACGDAPAQTPTPDVEEVDEAASPTPAATVESKLSPPGPVEALAKLPTAAGEEFIAGVGPIQDESDPDTLDWQAYRGRAERWNRQNWPRDARPRVFRPSPNYAVDRTVFALPFSYAFLGRGQPWGLLRSRDGGFGWEQILEGLDDPYAMALALSPGYASDNTLYAVTWYNGLYRSLDGGDTWQHVPLPGDFKAGGGPNPYDLALGITPDGEKGDFMLVSASGRMYSTHWKGGSIIEPWRVISTTVLPVLETGSDMEPQQATLAAGAVAFSPGFASDGTIYVYSGYAGLFRSPDGGENWYERGFALPPPVPYMSRVSLAASSVDEVYLLYEPSAKGLEGRHLFRMTVDGDGDEVWHVLDWPDGQVSAFELELLPENGVLLHIGGSRGGVFTYSPADLEWERVYAYQYQ